MKPFIVEWAPLPDNMSLYIDWWGAIQFNVHLPQPSPRYLSPEGTWEISEGWSMWVDEARGQEGANTVHLVEGTPPPAYTWVSECSAGHLLVVGKRWGLHHVAQKSWNDDLWKFLTPPGRIRLELPALFPGNYGSLTTWRGHFLHEGRYFHIWKYFLLIFLLLLLLSSLSVSNSLTQSYTQFFLEADWGDNLVTWTSTLGEK